MVIKTVIAIFALLFILGSIACNNNPGEPARESITALPPLYEHVSEWAIDAPDDSDQAAFIASGKLLGSSNGTMGYKAKSFSEPLRSLKDLPSILNSGTPRFRPVVVDGVTVIEHTIQEGDALRWQGNRSGLVYDFPIYHGHDYWFAWAFKLGTEWQTAKSGGHNDRTSLLDTHQEEASIGNPSGLNWWGDSPPGHELWWYVERYDGSGAAFLYNAAAAPGQWQRVILHYRSGTEAQKPVYDVWLATGSGDYQKLEKIVDPYTRQVWTTTPAFGDSLTNTLPQADYIKLEVYKWTTAYYGNIPKRTMWSSGIFGSEGIDLYKNAVKALEPYAH